MPAGNSTARLLPPAAGSAARSGGGHESWQHGAVRPVDEAIAIASRFGLAVSRPATLSDSNNVVVWLRPWPVVAKVAAGHHRRVALELSVAKHRVSAGAPVVRPAEELPQEVHRGGHYEVTFWAYQPHHEKEPDGSELARALWHLHRALLSYDGALPSYQDELSVLAGLLSDESRAPALPARDRSLLLTALGRWQSGLAQREVCERPLQGSPHSGNALVTEGGVRFIDFETACLGPLEWDLAHVGDETWEPTHALSTRPCSGCAVPS
jgi:hypothetical protein